MHGSFASLRMTEHLKSSGVASTSVLPRPRRNQTCIHRFELELRLVQIWRELGEVMTANCTVIRYNKKCEAADAKVVELLQRYQKINLSDRSQWANTTIAFARQLYNMLQLSRVIAQGAAMRDESRGSHYKPDFPERDDKNWMKTTKASFAPDLDEPKFEFEAVDASLIPPRPRKY